VRPLLAFARLPLLPALVCCLAAAGCQAAAPASQVASATADPDPKNELPFGFIDAPSAGAGVGRQIQMYGWAVDDQGVREIRIFVDGKFIAKTTLSVARPDVASAHPAYTHGNDKHGWALTITLGPSFQPGEHTILAQAVDTQGATRDIGTVAVSLGP
jgi:hypothetical protein